MAEGYNYGNLTGTSRSKFYVVCQINISSKEATRYYIRHKYFVQVTQGNFNGTQAYCSWSGSSFSLNGTGFYIDSGWIDDGWYSSNQTVSFSAYAYYDASKRYQSNVSCSYTVPNLIQKPNAPKDATVVKDSDTQVTITWTNNPDSANNKPVDSTYIDRQIDDGDWSNNINTTSSGTQTSLVVTDQSANHKYYYRLCHHNEAGYSDYVYAGPIYTTAPAPTISDLLILSKNNSNYSLSFKIVTDNINNPGENKQWQYSIDNGSTWRGGENGTLDELNTTTSKSVNLTQDTMDAILLSYIKTMKEDISKRLYIRARAYLSDDSTLTDWSSSSIGHMTLMPSTYIRVPDNATIKSIWIRIPDNTYLAANQTLYTGNNLSVDGQTATVASGKGSVSDSILTLNN